MSTINPPAELADPDNQFRLEYVQDKASQLNFDYPPVRGSIENYCILDFWFATYNGVGTNFGMGVEEARPEGPRAGVGFLGRGQPAPAHSHQLGVCGSAVSSLSGVWGGALAAEGFSCILSRHIAFPSILLRVAYTFHG